MATAKKSAVKKKPTPAQLAARKAFAAAAKAGTLQKGISTRAKNPAKKTASKAKYLSWTVRAASNKKLLGVFTLEIQAMEYAEFYADKHQISVTLQEEKI